MRPPQVYDALEKLDFREARVEKWLNGVGTLMLQQTALGIRDRDEVEEAMEYHDLDDAKVITLMQETHELEKRKAELGSPTRDEIKKMMAVVWDAPDRLNVAARCLGTYMALMGDESTLMAMFAGTPNDSDKEYLRVSMLRFNGHSDESMAYLRKVSEIINKGEQLGNPDRERVIRALDEHGLDQRKAQAQIREEYHKLRDQRLKEEYQRKKAEAAKAQAAAP